MIQWFPGHMNKAKKALIELMADIDIVIELLDARAPFSSCNPLIQNIIKYKKKIRLLNKSDIADDSITQEWLHYFKQQDNTEAIAGNMNNSNQKNILIKLCRNIAPHRNSFEKPLRVIITGIPNVGKSTLINQLIGKKSAKTGDLPAVTKANQRLIVADDFLVYDTPGMMWEKIEYPQIGLNLALCNSIGRNALDEESMALYLLDDMKLRYPKALMTRYKLKLEQLNLYSDELINIIGKKRGCIAAGGVVDMQKASEIIIQDFRDGRIGKLSLETPKMWEEWQEQFVIEDIKQQ